MADNVLGWLRELLQRFGPHGDVWRARDRLARTLAEVGPAERAAFSDVLPALEAVLEVELPRLDRQAGFLRRYLNRARSREAQAEVRRWEHELYATDDPALRAVRQQNFELAREQLSRIERLEVALARYNDQVSGLVLAIDEAASRIALAGVTGADDAPPEIERLRGEIEELASDLADLNAEL